VTLHPFEQLKEEHPIKDASSVPNRLLILVEAIVMITLSPKEH